MRIAFVYDAVYPYTKGGGEKRVYALSRELVSLGHEVHIFCLKFWKGEDTISREGIFFHGVCPPYVFYAKSGRRSILGPVRFAAMLTPPLLKEKRFDVIDCQSFPYFPIFSCRIASQIKSSKLFVTWYEFWGDYWYRYVGWPLGFFGKIAEALALSISPNIIAISEFTRRRLKKRNLHVVPSGVDYRQIKEIRPLKKKFDVMFVGRLIKEKNVDLLLRAVASMSVRYPRIKCCIIGDGPEKPRILELVSSLGIKRNVEFRNFNTDEGMFSYLKSSRVLALPSSREGFGTIVIEANACGIPVVTVEAEDNAAKELIKNGINGKVVKFSPEALATGIEQSFNTKVKPSKEYDWKEIAKKLEEVYLNA